MFLTLTSFSQKPTDTVNFLKIQEKELYLNQLIEIKINEVRKEHGLNQLISDTSLRVGSKRNCVNLYNIEKGPACGHTEGGNFYEISVTDFKQRKSVYTYEYLVWKLVNAWMNSKRHREIILEKKVRYFGSGFYYNNKKTIVKTITKNLKTNESTISHKEENLYFLWTSVRFTE